MRLLRWLRRQLHRRHSIVLDWEGQRMFLRCTECEWRSEGVRIE